MSNQPIGNHAMLSDSQTVALVDRRGSVEWWCTPAFDSPAVFARILDDDAGHFSVRPREVNGVERRYLDRTLILETEFTTPTGTALLVDLLVLGEGERGHDLGFSSPQVLMRRLTTTAGTVEFDLDFKPRFEFGLTFPLVHSAPGGAFARGGPTTLRLSSPTPVEADGSRARASFRLSEGQSTWFTVESVSSWEELPEAWTARRADQRFEDTRQGWLSWEEEHQRYQGPYAELVEHSGRVLQGLTYRPTGAMVAAPTTSLPEAIGGERNWDYRYCWIRDAGFTLRALWVAACPDEAGIYLDYMTAAASSVFETGEMQIMFGIDGRRDLSERTLPWLDGWRNSRPVRVGNGAWDQTQHDVYGELLSAVHRLRDQIGELDDIERALLRFLADRAAEVWREPDHGIWEIRDEPRHHLYSKLMCWVALDSAIALADRLHAEGEVDRWEKARGTIRDLILERGYSEEAGAFTQSFGSEELDASSLVIPIVGFLPYDDGRVQSTIEAVRDGLVDERGLVYRYRTEDGLQGEEGSFLLCTFWLSEALAGSGRVEEAIEIFERAISYRNDVGLLSEEVDTETGELIGNFPQAFSHVGLINAAWAISQAGEAGARA